MSSLFRGFRKDNEDGASWVNHAWLGLGDISKIERINPLIKRSQADIANPGMLEAKLMRDPNYLAFTCKVLLDIQLLPEQCVILQELWTKPFPMYVASRGFGKSFLLALYGILRMVTHPGTKIVIVGSGFRQAKIIFEYMESIWRDAPILRDLCTADSGPRRDVDRCTMKLNIAGATESYAVAIPLGDGCLSSSTLITTNSGFGYLFSKPYSVWSSTKFRNVSAFNDNGKKPTKIITTKKGFSFEGTYNHRMKICRNRKIEWRRADEMKVGDRILIDKTERLLVLVGFLMVGLVQP